LLQRTRKNSGENTSANPIQFNKWQAELLHVSIPMESSSSSGNT